MTPRLLLVAVLAALTTFAPAHVARAQTGPVIDAAVEALARNNIYVHPDAETTLNGEDIERLRDAVAAADIGSVYVAVLPESARDEAGGSYDAVVAAVAAGLERPGTYAAVIGRTLRAGATQGVFPVGVVPAAASDALGVADGSGNAGPVLLDLVARLEAAAAGADSGGQAPAGAVAVALPLLLLIGVGGALLYTRSRRRRRGARELEEVRNVARDDLTTLGNELYDLEQQLLMPDTHPTARKFYGQATTSYVAARELLERARRTTDLSEVTAALEEGRFAAASARADLEGRPLPEHRAPCFFNPQHGPSLRDVEWAPPGGLPRAVPACEADALRVEHGDEPAVREVEIAGRRRPYWDTPAYYGPWAGGYYGGFGGLGFLQGMLWGSVFTGGWGGGFGAGGWGGGDAGDFGGGDFGGGDFGGGDFGGGDFGGGDF